MASMYDQIVEYVTENPALVMGVCVAVLIVAGTQVVVSAGVAGATSGGALTQEYRPYPLVDKMEVSHNTRIFRFALPSEDAQLGLPLGRHISLRFTADSGEVRRPYTPISSEEDLGYFELLVKVYAEPHGTMSRHLESLAIGDSIDVRGPLGKFVYSRNGHRRINMVCGGTGITPMWQVFRAILADPSDLTTISLVFANVTADDILLRDQLDQLAASEPRFSVFYVLNDPPAEWSGGVGFVTAEHLKDNFGPPESDSCVLMCGPPPMNKAMKANLATLGYKDSQIFKF